MQIDLSIIIVSWNVWDLLRACLTSIEQVSRATDSAQDVRAFGPATPNSQPSSSQAPLLEVIVVDNASSDATADLLPARFPWVRLIRSATNLGFTAGNNVGYATSRGRAIYFLNPDTELVSNQHQANTPGVDSLWTLYRALMDHRQAGLVGPQLRFADNTIQSSRRRFPTPLTAFFGRGMLARYWRNNPWLRRFQMDDWPPDFRQEVDWVSGAAMLARRAALDGVLLPGMAGPFDEGFFMYSEEVDLCKRLTDAGWRIVFVPEAVVIHYEAQSSGQVIAARNIHFYRSMIRYQEKYFGNGWARLLHLFTLWNFVNQLTIETGKWLLGHKREMRAKRIAAYRQVLVTKLRPEAEAPPTVIPK